MKLMKLFFIITVFNLLTKDSFAQPIISSFAPQSGGIGTSVTITGSGFNPVIANNIVFFGAVKAQITAASASSIVVNVPIGATYNPITVTNAGLTGYSQKPFIITFASAPTFNTTSFANKIDFASGNYPRNVSIGDIDGDGKSDLASVNNNGNNVSIFRNISTSGNLLLSPPIFISTDVGPFGEKLVDIDGDGKLDLITNNYTAKTFSLFRNTSTIGIITFAPPLILTANQNCYWIEFADFNNDGKPELISFNQNSDSYTIFTNASSIGNLSFPQRMEAPLGFRPSGGTVADLDGDNKVDFAVAGTDDNTVSIFRNTSTLSTFSFAPKVTYSTAIQPFNVTAADIDLDGKKELLVPNASSSSFSIFKNNSSSGNISFSPKIDFSSGSAPLYISVNDLDGDGKIDIAVANFSSSTVSVFKNLSTTGNIGLGSNVTYATGTLCRSVPIGDIDGDGRPDIVSSNSISSDISILRNTTISTFCSNLISTFPYREIFEVSNGGWSASGNASDWAWGSPSKLVITNAAEGNKCWITGGLNNPSYSNNQKSYLQGPCFNFSTLVHPRISFKLFWEIEKINDGLALQYTIDAGANWITVGNTNSNANCLGENWYNSSSITSINSADGWTGNKQPTNGSCLSGNGSNNWLTSSHDLSNLAGQPNVSFRFIFGSNNSCNSFDGIAIDDVNIFESIPSSANFNYLCNINRSVSFTNLTSCSSSQWNFDDINSGTNNNSNSNNPTHVFSGPGLYSVTLVSTFPNGTSSNVTKPVTILDVSATLTIPVSCAGTSTATLSALATGSSSNYNYTWNTSPTQSSSIITNIGVGNYTVTATSGIACPALASIIVSEPTMLKGIPSIVPQKCVAANGSINSNVSGGTTPYVYLWSNNQTTSNINNLNAGFYSLQVKDNNGCLLNLNSIEVKHTQENVFISLGADINICNGEKVVLNPGSFFSYLWQDSSTSKTFTVAKSGTYKVIVTDTNGCTGSAIINATEDCSGIYFPTSFTPNNDTKNDFFGPAGNNLSTLKNYIFNIYNRYGEIVFSSTNPYKKWNGLYKNIIKGNESFVWFASYLFNGKKYEKKGSMLLIR
jgi:gliding motility-associated-like protein